MPPIDRRIELALVQLLGRLPAAVQVALSGRRPVRIDGNTLDPGIQLLITARRLRYGERSLRAETPEKARRQYRGEVTRYTTGTPEVGAVEELTVAGATGLLGARHYSPEAANEPHPLMVYLHGGGFVTGDLETHDEACRILCREGRVHVLAVEYRLAPEHRFPAALEDALAALQWGQQHAAELGADPERVGIGGDSAGGNLSAVVSQQTHATGAAPPAFQLLIYPATDMSHDRPSRSLFAEGLFLTANDMAWANENYFESKAEARLDPRISPMLAEDLTGLCPAIVATAGFDPLRDEGDEYAEALEQAGVSVTHLRFPSLVHGFINMPMVSTAAREATTRVARELRALSRQS